MPLITVGTGRIIFRSPSIVSADTTIGSWTLTANDTGWENFTHRNVFPITAAGGPLNQFRVTFEASSANTWKVDNASLGISIHTAATADNASDAETTATPVELLFSGASGFTLTAGTTIVSDWVTLAGVASTSLLVVVQDVSNTGGNSREISGLGAVTTGGTSANFKAATNSYNVASPISSPDYTVFNGRLYGINKVETR